MSMKVKTRLDLRPFRAILNLSLDLINLWMEYLGRLFPPSVQIHSCDITSEVSVDNSIYINHRIYLYDAVIKNILDLRSLL